MKIVRSVSLSEELWERVEKARGRESRSGFVERMLEGALEGALEGTLASPRPLVPRRQPEATGAVEVVEASSSVVYMCPEERCFQTSAKPGVCPSHRSRRMVRA